MTETTEPRSQDIEELITEAVALIDRGLTDMLHRELVSTDEVANLLLDVRTVLNTEALRAELEETLATS
jgi:orotate phosphoribosyltransferase-like protein